jgi:hypothetical protein
MKMTPKQRFRIVVKKCQWKTNKNINRTKKILTAAEATEGDQWK